MVVNVCDAAGVEHPLRGRFHASPSLCEGEEPPLSFGHFPRERGQTEAVDGEVW